MPDHPTGKPNIRHDIGGWVSGPMLDSPSVRPVPPGLTPLQELVHAIAATLALPRPATTRDELTYLRISRDRSRLVPLACRKILADREIEDDDRDIMLALTSLRDEAASLPNDQYDHAPDPS